MAHHVPFGLCAPSARPVDATSATRFWIIVIMLILHAGSRAYYALGCVVTSGLLLQGYVALFIRPFEVQPVVLVLFTIGVGRLGIGCAAVLTHQRKHVQRPRTSTRRYGLCSVGIGLGSV